MKKFFKKIFLEADYILLEIAVEKHLSIHCGYKLESSWWTRSHNMATIFADRDWPFSMHILERCANGTHSYFGNFAPTITTIWGNKTCSSCNLPGKNILLRIRKVHPSSMNLISWEMYFSQQFSRWVKLKASVEMFHAKGS